MGKNVGKRNGNFKGGGKILFKRNPLFLTHRNQNFKFWEKNPQKFLKGEENFPQRIGRTPPPKRGWANPFKLTPPKRPRLGDFLGVILGRNPFWKKLLGEKFRPPAENFPPPKRGGG